MKLQKIYAEIYDYLKNSDGGSNRRWLDRVLEEGPRANIGRPVPGSAGQLAELLMDIQGAIIRAENRKAGRGGLEKAMLKIIKHAGKRRLTHLAGYMEHNGRLAVCDGYRVIQAGPGLVDIGAARASSDLNIAELFVDASAASAVYPLPTQAALRAHIKIEKAKQKSTGNKTTILWDQGEFLPLLDAELLLDMLAAFDSAAYDPDMLLSAVHFVGPDQARGLLLPIRR